MQEGHKNQPDMGEHCQSVTGNKLCNNWQLQSSQPQQHFESLYTIG